MQWTFLLTIFLTVQAINDQSVRGYNLPPQYIQLNSTDGLQLLANVTNMLPLLRLLAVFETQQNQAFCSVATSVMILNALTAFGLAAPKTIAFSPFPYFTQNSLFAYPCVAGVPTRNGAALDALFIATGVSALVVDLNPQDFEKLDSAV